MKPLEIIAELAERWPKCFHVYERHRRPLKVGISQEILAVSTTWTQRDLSKAIGWYTGCIWYQQRLAIRNNPRIDLEGNPAGAVTAEEAERAKVTLAKMRTKRRQRAAAKEAAEKVAEPPKDLKAHIRARLLSRTTRETSCANVQNEAV